LGASGQDSLRKAGELIGSQAAHHAPDFVERNRKLR
jgi:hypothetical protein